MLCMWSFCKKLARTVAPGCLLTLALLEVHTTGRFTPLGGVTVALLGHNFKSETGGRMQDRKVKGAVRAFGKDTKFVCEDNVYGKCHPAGVVEVNRNGIYLTVSRCTEGSLPA